MKPIFIYALRCPITRSVRYVGKTANLKTRFRNHASATDARNNHRTCWLRSLKAKGLQPLLEILDEVPGIEGSSWEVAYIAFFRELGCDLVNATPGGEGFGIGENHPCYGRKQTPEAIAKRVAKITGQKRTPAQCASLSAALTGRKLSPAHCAKTGARMRGKPPWNLGLKASSAAIANQSAAHVGVKRAKESIEKGAAIHRGKKKKNNTSGFVGVSRGGRNDWRAEFRIRKLRWRSVRFKKIEDAVFARALAVALQ